MIFIPSEKLEKLKTMLGEEETTRILDLFSGIEKDSSQDPNKDINQIVDILDIKLGKIKARFIELSAKKEDPLERIKVLSYVIKSAISEM